MDYTKLEKIVDKEGVTQEEIFEFFGVANEKEMEDLIIKNLKGAKIALNDDLGYISPELIYDFTTVEKHNIFYERLMVISFFLRAFSGYDTNIIKSFVMALGVIKFVFMAEKTLKGNDEFEFFRDSFNQYKKDRYFREQTDRLLGVYDEITKNMENLDLTDLKKMIDELPSEKNNKAVTGGGETDEQNNKFRC